MLEVLEVFTLVEIEWLIMPNFVFCHSLGMLYENEMKTRQESFRVLSSCKHKYKVSHRHSQRLINQMEQRDCLSELVISHWAKPHAEEMKSKWGQSNKQMGWFHLGRSWNWGELCNKGWEAEGHCDNNECEHHISTLKLQKHKLNGCLETQITSDLLLGFRE